MRRFKISVGRVSGERVGVKNQSTVGGPLSADKSQEVLRSDSFGPKRRVNGLNG
jgi:hypothetical protein